MALPDANQLLSQAFRLEQLGCFAGALEGYRKALETHPKPAVAVIKYFRLLREVGASPANDLKLVWQLDPGGNYWETDWVRYLLSGLNCTEIIDCRYSEFHNNAIIVDCGIDSSRSGYYFELLKRGFRFALVHLSDEHYTDDCTAYSFANFVIRNYWSRAHAPDRNILSVPLGVMNGFRVSGLRTTSDRRYIWAFAGNIGKSSRLEMAKALSSVSDGFLHHTDAVNPAAARDHTHPNAPLAIADYADVMSNAVFAPCPGGWENLDSFRVCEALEAGCIPIVEKRPGFDYFRHIFGEHPMMTVESWTEARELINRLRENETALNARRLVCANWWKSHKADLVIRIREAVLQSFRSLPESDG